MKKELAFFKMDAVADWNGYTRIMSNYLLESAVPILFNDLLHKCNYINDNKIFNTYKIKINKYNYKEILQEIAGCITSKAECTLSGNDSSSQDDHSGSNPNPDAGNECSNFYSGIKDQLDEDCEKVLQFVANDNHIKVTEMDLKHIKSTYYKLFYAPQNKEQNKNGNAQSQDNGSTSATQQEEVNIWNWFYLPDPRIPGGLFWKENNAHQAVWTMILKKQLAEFSKLRMLGEQTEDMRDYHCNSYNYIRLICKLFIHRELPASQEDISHEFLQMLRDYLLRNVPGLPENAAVLSMTELLTECEELYANNKTFKKSTNNRPAINTYYVDFRTGRYASELLKQIKEISKKPNNYVEEYPHLNCYLGNVEYLYTFILYVYMTEYLLCYSPASTPYQKQYNLFRELSNIDYTDYFERYVTTLKKKRNK